MDVAHGKRGEPRRSASLGVMRADDRRKRASFGRWWPSAAALGALAVVLAPAPARAVVVRGTVRDGQGRVVPGARVQLIFGQRTASYAVSGNDGAFEIRDGDSGRFVLLTSASSFAPQIGVSFYGGRTGVVVQDVVLSPTEVRTEVSVTASGVPTPLPQVVAPVGLISRDALDLRIGVVDEMRLMPGVNVVQQGQWGGVASLFVHGGGSDATKVLIDGVPATDIGGAFDFGTVSSTGFAGPGAGDGIEVYRGANSASAGTDALAGVVELSTPRGSELKPVLTYTGDAGTLHSYRNEAIVSGVWRRLDYLTGFSRFDTSNALAHDQFDSETAVGNVGVALTARTPLRVTVRDATSGSGLPDAYDFHHIAASGRQTDQDIYGAATVENTTLFGWHNLLRYGIARKREQAESFAPVGEPVMSTFDGYMYTTYYGLPVTIRGANGYFASGQAAFYPPGEQRVSNRDQLFYQSDAKLKSVVVDFGFRYTDERGVFSAVGYSPEQIARRNFGYSLGMQGEFWGRLFYSAAGAVEKNHLFGLKGTPRFGLGYQLIRPSARPLRGTRLRASAATGVQEPSLSLEYSSLYRELLAAGDTAAIAQYGVTPATALRSRTLDFGVDQNLVGETLVLHAGVFHNQFSRQFDFVDTGTLTALFGLDPTTVGVLGAFGGAELNSLAYRAEGAEAELDAQPARRLRVRVGYTYLATRVEQSFASDAAAVASGTPTENPTLPGIAIGATSPLVGGRVFRRPPHTGFATLQYTGERFGVVVEAAAASRADDSTFLSYSDINGGNTLLLPNRDLDFGYVKLDVGLRYALQRRVTVFTELENLTNDQHTGPIGYPGLPFTVRAGLKVRVGGYGAR